VTSIHIEEINNTLYSRLNRKQLAKHENTKLRPKNTLCAIALNNDIFLVPNNKTIKKTNEPKDYK
jgi:hypothetical protein